MQSNSLADVSRQTGGDPTRHILATGLFIDQSTKLDKSLGASCRIRSSEQVGDKDAIRPSNFELTLGRYGAEEQIQCDETSYDFARRYSDHSDVLSK
jgi:hypothetical protein